MSAGTRLRRHGRRLALVTCALGAVAAISSGSALADPGLSSLVTGITGPLPPAVTEPIDEVGAAVDPVVDPVVDQVQGQVDAATAAVDETVDETTGLVDATVSGAAPAVDETVDDTLGAAGDTLDTTLGGASSAPPSPSPPDASPDTRAAAAIAADGPYTTHAPGATPTGSPAVPAQLESAALPQGTERAGILRSAHASPAAVPPNGRSSTLADTTISAAPPAPGVDVPTATDPHGQVSAGDVTRAPGNRPASPLPRPHGDSLLFGWLPSEPPPTAPLLAALLALLALAAPLAGGRRLHPAVALLHPTDVRFRLVRPG